MITERPVSNPAGQPPVGAVAEAPASGRRDVRAVVAAYVALTKPRIVELLLVTTVPAMMLADGGMPSLWLVAVVLVGGSLAAGAASVLNCYIDRDIDQLMRRTKRRPLPAHTVSPRSALIFGLVLAAVSVALMAATTNWLATVLTLAAIAYYDLVYTLWLKRTTAAEHVLGRHLRRRAGADRLGRCHRLAGAGRVGPVRCGLLLADAALLRAGHQVQGRLRARRRADAAGGGLGPAGQRRDHRLLLADGALLAGGLAARDEPDLRRRPRSWSAGSSSSRRTSCAGARRAARRSSRCGCSTGPPRTSRSSSRPSRSTRCSDPPVRRFIRNFFRASPEGSNPDRL